MGILETAVALEPSDPKRKNPVFRFFDKVLIGDGCWEWTGARDRHGYGRFDKGSHNAHRYAYEWFVGPADGLHVDHLCRNPGCVNPRHLEAVPMAENVRRGIGPTAVNARKTHCLRGHPFDEENTQIRRGSRICLTCLRAYQREWYAKQKRMKI